MSSVNAGTVGGVETVVNTGYRSDTNGEITLAAYDQGSHYYNFSIPLCLGCSPRTAFDVVRAFSAPGAGYAQNGTHKVILTGNNPISQTVDPDTLTITNTTLPGHVFYPGTVKLSVGQDQGGVVSLNVVGQGTGPYATDNQIFGPAIFFSLGIAAYDVLNPNNGVNTMGGGPH
jgi:hypothetical protein